MTHGKIFQSMVNAGASSYNQDNKKDEIQVVSKFKAKIYMFFGQVQQIRNKIKLRQYQTY